MNTLSSSVNSEMIHISENPYYKEKEAEFLAWAEKRINIFIEHYDLPEDYAQEIFSQIPSKIKKYVSSITINSDSQVIEKYKIEFFLDSNFENDICNRAKYCIWRRNMEKYIQTPASITPRISKILSFYKVENTSNISVEDFLLRFESFEPPKVRESLYQEKTTLDKHSLRVIQAQDYVDSISFDIFSEDKISKDGWFTGFYESINFPEIEQKSTVPDLEYQKMVAERKNNESQPFFVTEKLKVNPTKKVEKTTQFTVAAVLFAGALVAGSIYNLQSIDENKSQENLSSAMKFNESGFHRAFQDMVYSEMQKGSEWSKIEDYVKDHAGRIAYDHGLDASLFKFNVAIIKDEVVLKLQQYGQVVYLFNVPFGMKFPYYTDYFYDVQFSGELKMYLSIALNDYKMKASQQEFQENIEDYLYEKMTEYVRINQDNGKYSPFKGVISRNYNEIKIEFIFTKDDLSINYQTELIIYI